jgi:uncharacterized repeat protein (TIGR02543 family)
MIGAGVGLLTCIMIGMILNLNKDKPIIVNGEENITNTAKINGNTLSAPDVTSTPISEGEITTIPLNVEDYTSSSTPIIEVEPEITDEYGNIIPTETDENGDIIQVFDPDSPVYLLQFNLNGGAGFLEAINAQEGRKIKLPTNENNQFIRKDYEFIGWTDDPTISYPIFDFSMPNENATLYAVWKEAKEAETPTPSGNSGGSGGNSVVITTSTTTKTQAPTTETTKIETEPKKTVTVTLIGDIEKSAQVTRTYKVGEKLDLNQDFGFTRENYVVSGWKTANGTRMTSISSSSDITLYAIWAEKRYVTVTLDRSYAESPSLELKSYIGINGKASVILPNFANDDVYNHVSGYTYGWSTIKGSNLIEYYGGEKIEFAKNTKL